MIIKRIIAASTLTLLSACAGPQVREGAPLEQSIAEPPVEATSRTARTPGRPPIAAPDNPTDSTHIEPDTSPIQLKSKILQIIDGISESESKNLEIIDGLTGARIEVSEPNANYIYEGETTNGIQYEINMLPRGHTGPIVRITIRQNITTTGREQKCLIEYTEIRKNLAEIGFNEGPRITRGQEEAFYKTFRRDATEDRIYTEVWFPFERKMDDSGEDDSSCVTRMSAYTDIHA